MTPHDMPQPHAAPSSATRQVAQRRAPATMGGQWTAAPVRFLPRAGAIGSRTRRARARPAGRWTADSRRPSRQADTNITGLGRAASCADASCRWRADLFAAGTHGPPTWPADGRRRRPTAPSQTAGDVVSAARRYQPTPAGADISRLTRACGRLRRRRRDDREGGGGPCGPPLLRVTACSESCRSRRVIRVTALASGGNPAAI